MNFRTRVFAFLLALVMAVSLAACADTGADPDASPTIDTGVKDLWQAAAGLPSDFELLTINGNPVEAQFYLYWLVSNVYQLEQNFLYMFGEGLDWSDEVFADSCKADALNAAQFYLTIVFKARELGLEMTQEQVDELEAELDQVREGLGGQEALEDELRKIGLDYDTYYTINATYYYYERLCDNLYPEMPSDEELDILGAKHILLMTVDPSTKEALDEETIAEKKATAEALLSQLRAAEGEAQLALFDELMNEYSEDTGLAANPDGYLFTAGTMVSAFEDTTRALEFGQISDVVESEWGYHIILRLDPVEHPDIEATREEAVAVLTEDQINAWIKEADIVFSEEYENLNVQRIYETFTAYQAAFQAEAEAAEQAEE